MSPTRIQLRAFGLIGTLLSGLALPMMAAATTGYFGTGYSMKSKAMAGAGVAQPLDAMDAAINPANMAWVGNEWDLGLAWFSPRRNYTVTGAPTGFPGTFGLVPGNFDSESNNFFIPNFGINWMLSDDSAFGVSLYGNGGMNTDWKASDVAGVGTFGAGDAGVDLAQLFLNVSYARKFANNRASWGVSAIGAFQRFEAKGLANFAPFSNDPANLTDRGHDKAFGYGFKVGLQGEVAKGVRLGAAYQSKIWMQELDDYAGLFAEQGDFDIPQTATVGLAFDFNERMTLLFDVQWIDYSGIKSVGNPFGNSNPPFSGFFACAGARQQGQLGPNPNCLGGDGGAGFGWRDMTIYKLGLQWETDGGWTWRLGGSIANRQPIPESEVLFNILAPGVIEEHITFGFTKKLDDRSGIDVSLMYAPSTSVSGPNRLEAPGAQTIEIEMKQYEVGVQYTREF